MKKIALSLILACGVAMAAEANATEANKTAEANATAAAATSSIDAAALYKKCAGCHGADGKTPALGKSAPIAGLDPKVIEEDIKGYQAGTLNKQGMGGVMKGQVAGLKEEEIKALAEYISKLGK